MITVSMKNGVSRLTLAGDMTIHTARRQKDELLKSLAACDEIEIDLAGVSALDTAGLQLLLLVKMEAAMAGKKARVVEYSPSFVEVFQRYSLKRPFGASPCLPSIA